MFGYYYDPTMIILIPALIIAMWAQYNIKSTFNKYSKIYSSMGYTGKDVARIILDSYGLFDIPIEMVRGKLTDHYDPSRRVVRLSQEVYEGTSLSSIGVAAHEIGHAIQHKENYGPIRLRTALVPIANLGSNASWILFFMGIIFSIKPLVTTGIVLFAAVVLFQLVTLPVEFNASNRAIAVLQSKGILVGDEIRGARKVLNAAALTYVAAVITALSQLARLILISRRND
ncbi:MAG: zinc metallopeptidase [Clostridium argentinense]|uniref:Zinc metallopeptidase n=1 Tax=Clostridium faecium TaxID=2762223 RepID=A0ABR8YPK0_9CLOT|nr:MULTISPECIES: zinc metallopeptidase [Clostridium]MBD8046131.1 zinc metallopeptidase [Clostridium faecium]MBS5824051.1 zinc metallopeptidase [Clostridium argentinense]MDU1347699.1 zinc metallopeptidase [Clostridium argentinense]